MILCGLHHWASEGVDYDHVFARHAVGTDKWWGGEGWVGKGSVSVTGLWQGGYSLAPPSSRPELEFWPSWFPPPLGPPSVSQTRDSHHVNEKEFISYKQFIKGMSLGICMISWALTDSKTL